MSCKCGTPHNTCLHFNVITFLHQILYSSFSTVANAFCHSKSRTKTNVNWMSAQNTKLACSTSLIGRDYGVYSGQYRTPPPQVDAHFPFLLPIFFFSFSQILAAKNWVWGRRKLMRSVEKEGIPNCCSAEERETIVNWYEWIQWELPLPISHLSSNNLVTTINTSTETDAGNCWRIFMSNWEVWSCINICSAGLTEKINGVWLVFRKCAGRRLTRSWTKPKKKRSLEVLSKAISSGGRVLGPPWR